MHSRVLNGNPNFILPDYILFHLLPRVFGCVAFENVLHPTCEKFDNRSIPCAFIGYSPGKKGYKCMNPKDGLVYLYKDVTYVEHVPDFSNQGKLLCDGGFPKGEKCNDEGSRSQVVLPSENSSSIYPSSELRESHSTHSTNSP